MDTELTDDEKKYFEAEGETNIENKDEGDDKETTDIVEEKDDKTTDIKDDKKKETHKEKFVPHGAFHEERQRRKEVEKTLEAERMNRVKLEERLNILAETVKQRNAQQQKPQMPSFEEDPANHLRMQSEQEQARIERVEKMLKAQAEKEREAQNNQAFVSAYQAKAMEFASKAPDFKDAYNHTLQSRIDEYMTMGHTKEEAIRFTQNDERAIAINAMQRGLNPAEVLYNLARQRGYQRKDEALKEDLTTTQKGTQVSKSLGQISGRTQASKLSLEAIANMSDAEFAEATKGNNWEKLWG